MATNDLRVIEVANNRSSERSRNLRSGKVVFGADLYSRDCVIRDVSESGVRIRIDDPGLIPNELWLLDLRKFVAFKSQVKWRRGNELGLSLKEQHSLNDTETLQMKLLRMLAVEAKQRLAG